MNGSCVLVENMGRIVFEVKRYGVPYIKKRFDHFVKTLPVEIGLGHQWAITELVRRLEYCHVAINLKNQRFSI